MHEIYVVNVKCSGCVNSIKNELSKYGFKNINVHFSEDDSHLKRKITFEWDKNLAIKILSKLWYPLYWTQEASELSKKLKSFVSCAVWKIKKSQ